MVGGAAVGLGGGSESGDGVGEGESGIGKTVAEGEEGFFGEVAVGAIGHAVAGEGRELGDGFIERDGETAGGIVVAGEDVGDGGAAFFAGIPGFEDGGSVFIGPVDGEGAAAGQDNN